MNSPLGRYAPLVAAITAVMVVGAWVVAEFLAGLGSLSTASGLKEVALIAIGAVFGSAVAVNGYKAPLAAVHKRLDNAGIPPAGAAPATPTPDAS